MLELLPWCAAAIPSTLVLASPLPSILSSSAEGLRRPIGRSGAGACELLLRLSDADPATLDLLCFCLLPPSSPSSPSVGKEMRT